MDNLFLTHSMLKTKISLMSTIFLLAILIQLLLENNGVLCQNSHNSPFFSNCRTIIAELNNEYSESVKRDKSNIYVFHVPRKYLIDKNTNLRVEMEANHEITLEDPILFSVGQRKYISTFELPQKMSSDYEWMDTFRGPTYYSAGRTLCLYRHEDIDEGHNVTIRVSTSSLVDSYYKLKLMLTEDFQIPLNSPLTVEVSPTNTKFFGFQTSRPDIEVVKIKATSETKECLTLSVQSYECPIYDKEDNVRYQGLWQTMMTQTAMTVELTQRFQNGFVVALVVHGDDERCTKKAPSFINPYDPPPGVNDGLKTSYSYHSPRTKKVSLLLTNESRASDGIVFLVLFIPVFVTFCMLLIVTLLFRNRHLWMRRIMVKLLERRLEEPRVHLLGQGDNRVKNLRNCDEEQKEGRILEKWKAHMHISDFDVKDPTALKKSGRRFYWTIVIVAIFYSIPVYQLILHYLRVLFRTGEYDICYYNYLCAHRLWVFVDFNHFWSNISYIIFGFSFVFFVTMRAGNMKYYGIDDILPHEPNENWCKKHFTYPKIPMLHDHGIPDNFGIYYALGIALVMEGFMSAAYHLCPNQSSFQFDTCFMYVIAVLILLKIYQFRHSAHFGANHTFAILASFVLLSVIGLMFEFQGTVVETAYRWTFVVIQFVVMILLFLYTYSVGHIRVEGESQEKILTDWKLMLKLNKLRGQPIHKDRLIHPCLSLLLGVVVLIYSEISGQGFASYLLYLLVANVIGATLYYVAIMKPLHGEFRNRTWVQPVVYFLGAGVIGGFAVILFVQSPAQWELSAAASRDVNEECLSTWLPFYPYYDSHDAWHFLSAAALFLSFMGLLIVDDDLVTVPRIEIPVF